jgi:hypothetical protein
MQILFVDESGSPPEAAKAAEQPFFVLGGVVVPEDIWAKMAADLGRLKAQFSVDGEIKWRYFAPDRGGKAHALSHLSAAEKEDLRTRLFQVVGKYKSVRLICVVTNTEMAYKQPYIKTGDDLSVGIQFADMVAGAVFRAFRASDDRFAKQIKPSFRTSPVGKIDGYGLVKFPKGW